MATYVTVVACAPWPVVSRRAPYFGFVPPVPGPTAPAYVVAGNADDAAGYALVNDGAATAPPNGAANVVEAPYVGAAVVVNGDAAAVGANGDAAGAVANGDAPVDPPNMLGVVPYCGAGAAAVGKVLLCVVNGVCP